MHTFSYKHLNNSKCDVSPVMICENNFQKRPNTLNAIWQGLTCKFGLKNKLTGRYHNTLTTIRWHWTATDLLNIYKCHVITLVIYLYFLLQQWYPDKRHCHLHHWTLFWNASHMFILCCLTWFPKCFPCSQLYKYGKYFHTPLLRRHISGIILLPFCAINNLLVQKHNYWWK